MQAADVRSIEALRELHAAVCKFRTSAQDALATVDLTIRRANDWLSDQLNFWQHAIRTSEDEVFQAKQELAQRKYTGWDGREPDATVQEENLRKAQAKLRYAQDKVAAVRRWMQKFPHAVSEMYAGPARQLAASLETELPRGLALLERRVVALEQYAALAPPEGPREPAQPQGPTPQENPS
jgi:hypothetical protein